MHPRTFFRGCRWRRRARRNAGCSASAPDITLEPTCEVGAITGRRARRGWRCSSMTAARPVRRVALLLLLLIGAQAQAGARTDIIDVAVVCAVRRRHVLHHRL